MALFLTPVCRKRNSEFLLEQSRAASVGNAVLEALDRGQIDPEVVARVLVRKRRLPNPGTASERFYGFRTTAEILDVYILLLEVVQDGRGLVVTGDDELLETVSRVKLCGKRLAAAYKEAFGTSVSHNIVHHLMCRLLEIGREMSMCARPCAGTACAIAFSRRSSPQVCPTVRTRRPYKLEQVWIRDPCA